MVDFLAYVGHYTPVGLKSLSTNGLYRKNYASNELDINWWNEGNKISYRMAMVRARQCARAFQNRIFRFAYIDFTRSPHVSIWCLWSILRCVLRLRGWRTTSDHHHTSISCILVGYFKFSKNLNFQKVSFFFDIFAHFCWKLLKISKTATPVAVFEKNPMHFKMRWNHPHSIK